MTAPRAEASFPPAAMFPDKSILGCRYGSSRPQKDVPLYTALYRTGELLLDELVTASSPVEEFARARDTRRAARSRAGCCAWSPRRRRSSAGWA
ncbi:hypothetical protein GCM10010282_35990 [Streptomyces roseolus]|nr:hypothetical protein GCM10010282_35990 [Streptomyces roseolus]